MKKRADCTSAAPDEEWQHTPLNCNMYLLKTEPKEYSIDSFLGETERTGSWTGVRNFQARKVLRSAKRGDLCFIYHSSVGHNTGIFGVAKVVREAYPDPKQCLDELNKPIDKQWSAIDVQLIEKFARPLYLSELNEHKQGAIGSMQLFTQTRLSCSVVTRDQFLEIVELVNQKKINPERAPPAKKSKKQV